MVIALLLLLAAPDTPAGVPATAIARYDSLTRAGPACTRPDGDDVVVCGRRAADRFRAPLIEHDPGDPMYEGVPAERERLFARTNNCQEKSLFLVGCGSGVGVTASTASGIHPSGERPLAP